MNVSDSPHINMIQGDCMEAMAGMEDNAYELAIVDPPYTENYETLNKLLQNMDGRKASAGDYDLTKNKHWKAPDAKYFNELTRVSINQIIWGVNWYEFDLGAGRVVWNKDNKGSNFSDCELAYQSLSDKTDYVKYRWNGMLQENMKDKEIRIHENQKPVGLYKFLLTNYAIGGDRIIDTHGGSMSIAIACYDLGYDLDVYELDKDHYADAVERFKEHKKQGQLFRPEPKPQAKQGELTYHNSNKN